MNKTLSFLFILNFFLVLNAHAEEGRKRSPKLVYRFQILIKHGNASAAATTFPCRLYAEEKLPAGTTTVSEIAAKTDLSIFCDRDEHRATYERHDVDFHGVEIIKVTRHTDPYLISPLPKDDFKLTALPFELDGAQVGQLLSQLVDNGNLIRKKVVYASISNPHPVLAKITEKMREWIDDEKGMGDRLIFRDLLSVDVIAEGTHLIVDTYEIFFERSVLLGQ